MSQQTHTVSVSCAAEDIGGGVHQQDSGFSMTLEGPEGQKASIAAVFDGHGATRGHAISRMTCQMFQQEMSQDDWLTRFLESPEQVGRAIFTKASEAVFESTKYYLETRHIPYEVVDNLIETESMHMIQGGTTATIVVSVQDGSVHCFNVGDSEAWLCEPHMSQPLHSDHGPSNRSEYDRIRAISPESRFEYDYLPACGLRCAEGDHIFPPRDFKGYYQKNVRGEYATMFRVGSYQLAMTRSIGDEPLRRGGLSSEPSYKCVQVSGPAVIRVATDGFWDNVSEAHLAFPKGVLDANTLNAKWFRKFKRKAIENFGSSRDNMWGYTIVIHKH